MNKVRAKFYVQSIEGGKVVMNAVHDNNTPENERFTKATPSGKMEMTIDNPDALEFFEPNQMYYADFSKANK